MRLTTNGFTGHLGYCTNIHPGTGWEEVRSQLELHLPRVKARISPRDDMGFGLRLGARAAVELLYGSELDAFREWLAREGLYVFTVNGFPFSSFHAPGLKEEVYLPDWSSPLRREYTLDLVRILKELLPEGVLGTLSTLPLGWRPTDEGFLPLCRSHLLEVARELKRIHEVEGVHMVLALEPEPLCVLSSSADTVRFFHDHLFADCELKGLAQSYIGVCLDTSHAAVEFESARENLIRYKEAGITIAKMQLSSALRAPLAEWRELKRFCDPVYLHQSYVRRPSGEIAKFSDLPDLLARAEELEADSEVRVHYHVPISARDLGRLGHTAHDLSEGLEFALDYELCSHFEVETYTFSVLPPELAARDVVDQISAEIAWAQEHWLPD